MSPHPRPLRPLCRSGRSRFVPPLSPLLLSLLACGPGAAPPCPKGTAPVPTRDAVDCIPDTDGDGVADEVDCAPTDPTLSNPDPSAEEVCGDGIDNDCDGDVDEACPTDSAADTGR